MRYSVEMGRFPRVTHPSAAHPEGCARLACVKPAASVRSEPGSNSQVENLIYGYNQSHHRVNTGRKLLVTLKLTRTYLHTRQSRDHPGNIVLIKKRVRQSSLRQFDLSNHPQTMPPTFLFLLYKIIKEQTISKPSKISTRLQLQQPNLNPSNHPAIKVSSLRRIRLSGAGLLKHTV